MISNARAVGLAKRGAYMGLFTSTFSLAFVVAPLLEDRR